MRLHLKILFWVGTFGNSKTPEHVSILNINVDGMKLDITLHSTT